MQKSTKKIINFRLTPITKWIMNEKLQKYLNRLELKLLPTTPKDYISRFCCELKLSSDVQTKTLEILQEAAQQELTSG